MRFLFAFMIFIFLIVPSMPLLAAVPVDDEYFEKKVRPILTTHCQSCHDARKAKGGLLLTSRSTLLAGGDTGSAVTPGDAAKSLLVQAVRYDGDLRMPPKGKLAAEEIETLSHWVAGGAPWPSASDKVVSSSSRPMDVKALASSHWAYQPVRRPNYPVEQNAIDHFIGLKLAEKGLKPALPASKNTLLRRLTLDLIGLLPTIEEMQAFEADDSPDALAKVVDRLLASPHYGERWARHWLDLVRFAETQGHEFDFEIPNAWRYRDYVIRALNEDLPFDQFAREHIAGDLLKQPRRSRDGDNESILATGFWFLGEAKHSPVDIRQDQADRLDNMIDVFGKAFLGQTISCARCHDHKFDPVTQRDYYALFGILASSQYQQAYLDSPQETRQKLAELAKARKQLQHELDPSAQSIEVPAAEASSKLRWYSSGFAFSKNELPIHSGMESQHLRGVLRSETFAIPGDQISLLVAGRQSRLRLIIDNFQLIQNPIYGGLQKDVNHGEAYQWVTFDVARWKGHHAYLEVQDDGPGYVAIQDVSFESASQQKEVKARATPPPSISPELPANASKAAQELARTIRSLEMHLARTPDRAPAMAEGNGFNEKLFIRGNHKFLGDEVPRRFLELFTKKEAIAAGSGRLELAEEVTDPRNPLVSRVLVNRIWQHHFGVGIVASSDDFGRQGQPPSHPELLDFLTSEFVQQGWSIKKLHRQIVLSQTYRQSSKPHPDCEDQASAIDPANRLLHRAPVRRLEAEAIRDAILQVSGSLDRTIGGPSIPPHLTEHMNGRGRPKASGPLDGAGRRTIYLQIRRNFLSPMLVAFDYPTPFTAIGRRGASNVPAQALVMLNNPFVLQQAERWATRALHQAKVSDSKRLERMYQESLNRLPTQQESRTLLEFVSSREKEANQRIAWTETAHSLFNFKSFLFVE